MTERPLHDGNLVLPDGVDPAKLIEAISASGYPLQTVVARQLAREFNVSEEWGYVDRMSREQRALDVLALRSVGQSSSRFNVSLALLVECKRHGSPYVFFECAIPRAPSGFPTIAGLPTSKYQLYTSDSTYREVSPAAFMCLEKLAFVREPPLAVTFSRAERKGKGFELSGESPYNKVILPLISALEHFGYQRSKYADRDGRHHPAVCVCICVLDAPLVLATGTPEEPEVSTAPFVRVVFQESILENQMLWVGHDHFVDFVKRDYLGQYVSKLLVPFAEEVQARITEGEELMLAGRGRVQSAESWSWEEIQPARG